MHFIVDDVKSENEESSKVTSKRNSRTISNNIKIQNSKSRNKPSVASSIDFFKEDLSKVNVENIFKASFGLNSSKLRLLLY